MSAPTTTRRRRASPRRCMSTPVNDEPTLTATRRRPDLHRGRRRGRRLHDADRRLDGRGRPDLHLDDADGDQCQRRGQRDPQLRRLRRRADQRQFRRHRDQRLDCPCQPGRHHRDRHLLRRRARRGASAEPGRRHRLQQHQPGSRGTADRVDHHRRAHRFRFKRQSGRRHGSARRRLDRCMSRRSTTSRRWPPPRSTRPSPRAARQPTCSAASRPRPWKPARPSHR